jgi:hypothetical protein
MSLVPAAAWVAVLSLPVAGLGQPVPPRHGDVTTITISTSSAPPDGQAVLPIYLSVPDAVRVGAIDLKLAFPKAHLSFVKVEPSGLARGVDAILRSELGDDLGVDRAVVMLRISTIEQGGSREAIPAGPVAHVVFKVDKNARPESTIRLSHAARAVTTDTPPRAVRPLAASGGEVVVSSAPVPACFFFMH